MSEAKYARRVGYVGLGNMGGGIATRLARVGLNPIVFDLSPDAIQPVVAEGAVGADSVEELAAQSDTIIVCVDPHSAVLRVLEQIKDSLDSSKTVIVQSSIPPAFIAEAANIVEPTGAKFFDAPVSGHAEDRLNGTLAVLVGATEESVGEDAALLELIGRPRYYGKRGAGEIAKLSNNAIMTVTRRAAAEVMAFAAAYGLSEEDVIEATKISSGQSWVLDNWEYQNEQHRNKTVLRLGAKQIEGLLDAAAQVGVQMHLLEALREHGEDIDKARYKLLTGKDADATD
jgi:3-hydroxyisobutyrate dehydrogenase